LRRILEKGERALRKRPNWKQEVIISSLSVSTREDHAFTTRKSVSQANKINKKENRRQMMNRVQSLGDKDCPLLFIIFERILSFLVMPSRKDTST
jgi:hypothetical protein